MPQIVFLTLYLGLVSGRQPVEMRADAGIATVQLVLDGKPVASLTSAPWRAVVDFGSGLAPQQLVAIGYDKQGSEVARAEQTINVPRPVAEASVTVDARTFEVHCRHRMNEDPKRIVVRLDGKPIAAKDGRGTLPRVDLATPHLLDATLEFTTGSARVEHVFGGTLPDTTGTELTATAVRQTSRVPASLNGCFASADGVLKARAVEKPEALVVVVRNPDPNVAVMALGKSPAARSITDHLAREFAPLDGGTNVRLLWPTTHDYAGKDAPTAQLFDSSGDFDRQSGGMLAFLLADGRGFGDDQPLMRFADAAAVAGLQAADGARRRAVIVVLDGSTDASRYTPAVVRRYLDAIGVPLFVWSVIPPQPETVRRWGNVVQISSPDRLGKATDAVRRELESQRIVWLGTDPIHALRASLKPSCGLTMLAQR